MDQIEKVIYINLAHREDRKRQIERELSVFPPYKVMRFDAIYEKNRGHLGCSKSHIAVLEMAIANNWKNYLVVEDDMIWNNFETGSRFLANLFDKKPDVIVLGGTQINHGLEKYKLRSCTCTTAYLVFSHYYQTLLTNFKEGANLLEKDYNHQTPYAIDQYWHKLQRRHNWLIVSPIMCLQSGGYSDINRENVVMKLGDVVPSLQNSTQYSPPIISQPIIKGKSIGFSNNTTFQRSLTTNLPSGKDNIISKLYNWPPSRF